jgi:hypothetical protein
MTFSGNWIVWKPEHWFKLFIFLKAGINEFLENSTKVMSCELSKTITHKLVKFIMIISFIHLNTL